MNVNELNTVLRNVNGRWEATEPRDEYHLGYTPGPTDHSWNSPKTPRAPTTANSWPRSRPIVSSVDRLAASCGGAAVAGRQLRDGHS